MGKLLTKHECFFVSADMNEALEENIWKGNSGFNLSNYNMDDALSELSICLQEENGGSPLRVDFPPHRPETETSKVLKLDHVGVGNHGNKDGCDKNKLNIEEFECGLQFETSENAKQEWSFTLYDFDGNGRITKEDLASLLKALYDTVGSSIKLPPNGAKTLKLRLSVGQEHSPNLQRLTNSKCHDRSKNTNKTNKNKVREFSKMNNITRTQVKCTNEKQKHPTELTNQVLPGNHGQEVENMGQSLQGATNPLSMKNQQQLANLVQENMERNQIRQLRRHHSDSRNESHPHRHKRRHRNAGTHCPVTTVCAALSATMTAVVTEDGNNAADNSRTTAAEEPLDERAKESQDRRNYYLDLAGVENKYSKFQNNPTVPVAGSGFVRTGGCQSRSRSHDVSATVKCDNNVETKCDNPLEKCDNARRESDQLGHRILHARLDIQHPRSKSFDQQEVAAQNRSSRNSHYETGNAADIGTSSKLNQFRPLSLPLTTPAHYHRRHRHRERDHNVAMQQVAQWIEREHARDQSEEHVIVQRHEHHHIHDHHHHHHYHHYYES